MPTNTEYFSFQGRVMLGIRNADGSRAPARWVYDASDLEWQMEADVDELEESHSGSRGLAATMKTKRTLNVNLNLRQLNTENAALAMDGQTVEVTTGTITGEAVGDVTPGSVIALDYGAVSSLVINAGGSALTLNTDYTVNTSTGVVTFLTAQTAVTADYSYAAQSIVVAFSGTSQDYYLIFDGINTVDGTSMKCRGEVHNVSFDPSNFGFIQDSFGELSLSGKAKIDPVRQADPVWGGYARVLLFNS